MKVGAREGDHQLGKSTKALTDQRHPIDDITFIKFITSALNPLYLLLHVSRVILMVTVKVILSIITHQQ